MRFMSLTLAQRGYESCRNALSPTESGGNRHGPFHKMNGKIERGHSYASGNISF